MFILSSNLNLSWNYLKTWMIFQVRNYISASQTSKPQTTIVLQNHVRKRGFHSLKCVWSCSLTEGTSLSCYKRSERLQSSGEDTWGNAISNHLKGTLNDDQFNFLYPSRQLIFSTFTYLCTCVYVCVGGGFMSVPGFSCGGHSTAFRSWFFPPTMWVMGTELRFLGFVASIFNSLSHLCGLPPGDF